jgi:hypothetical protein
MSVRADLGAAILCRLTQRPKDSGGVAVRVALAPLVNPARERDHNHSDGGPKNEVGKDRQDGRPIDITILQGELERSVQLRIIARPGATIKSPAHKRSS